MGRVTSNEGRGGLADLLPRPSLLVTRPSSFNRHIRPITPLRPGAVVVGDVLVAHQGQHKRAVRRTDAPLSVGHYALATLDAGPLQSLLDPGGRFEARGVVPIDELFPLDVDRAGHAPLALVLRVRRRLEAAPLE